MKAITLARLLFLAISYILISFNQLVIGMAVLTWVYPDFFKLNKTVAIGLMFIAQCAFMILLLITKQYVDCFLMFFMMFLTGHLFVVYKDLGPEDDCIEDRQYIHEMKIAKPRED